MLQEKPIWKEKRYHPTQKPVPLIEWILNNYSKESEIILDPFCGSGSILMACKRLNRRFIGFDLVDEYVRVTEKRLNTIPLKLDLN